MRRRREVMEWSLSRSESVKRDDEKSRDHKPITCGPGVGMTPVISGTRSLLIASSSFFSPMSLESSDPLIVAKTLHNQCQCASFVVGQHPARSAELTPCHVAQPDAVLIDVLPDDVLLETFNFYMDEGEDKPTKKATEAWQSLVHVCRRWRSVVFGSPRRLDLQLVCIPKTPVKEMLNIWPPFPLLISGRVSGTSGVENIVAILEHRDRARKIHLDFLKSKISTQ
jgi:hypothetical protein